MKFARELGQIALLGCTAAQSRDRRVCGPTLVASKQHSVADGRDVENKKGVSVTRDDVQESRDRTGIFVYPRWLMANGSEQVWRS